MLWIISQVLFRKNENNCFKLWSNLYYVKYFAKMISFNYYKNMKNYKAHFNR